MFIVVALHDTGHGQVASPVILTEDIGKAYDAAMNVKDLGYEFHQNETGVGIYRMTSGRAYTKDAHKDEEDSPVVFYRRWNRYQQNWIEEWLESAAHMEWLTDRRHKQGAAGGT